VADGGRPASTFDGVAPDVLRARLGVPELHVFDTVGSTLDVAHRLAQHGSPAGTFIVSDRQTRGRGRSGRAWESPAGSGLWITLLERPADAARLQVLTLRLGLAAAAALDPFAGELVRVKWPNDLHVGAGKVAGVLVEARWHGPSLDWLAIGVGVNVIAPRTAAGAAGLAPGTTRLAVLDGLVPALRAAAASAGHTLTDDEMRAYERRDLARGRACIAPVEGIVRSINSSAELVVATSRGNVTTSTGSLVFREAV
jgi:BirA family biotin operon repressor/biotin-[acetyl-CoA-carboxylase] ligase